MVTLPYVRKNPIEKNKERKGKYDKKLKINTTLDDVLKASVPKKNKDSGYLISQRKGLSTHAYFNITSVIISFSVRWRMPVQY